VKESFEVIRNAVSRINGARAALISLSGDPAAELLRYVELAKIELLVLGRRRHFGFRRLLGGGVALKILREAGCSVLIIPESIADAAGDSGIADERTITLTDSASWPGQLQQFTRRNAGRHASMEVDGPAVGAMVEV